jgi:hypothetical protein
MIGVALLYFWCRKERSFSTAGFTAKKTSPAIE